MNFVTVCGHNTAMLNHLLIYYKPYIENFYVNIYETHSKDPIIEQANSICAELGITPYKIWIGKPFDWDKVTDIYNETIASKKDEWWIIADDDQFQIYSKPINEIIQECEDHGWEFVRGVFIDRIGEDSSFPEMKKITLEIGSSQK